MSEDQTKDQFERFRYGGYRLEPAEASGLLVDLVPQGARVLDVGCGDGTLAVMLRDNKNAIVVGLEPNSARASVATSRGIEVHQLELTASLVDRLGKFDVVMFADVLEHIPDPSILLQASNHMLLPNGIVIVSVPNVAHWTVRLNLLRGRFEYTASGMMDSTHLRWYTKSTILQLLKSNGFLAVETYASAGLWIWDYKERKPWRWLRESRKQAIIKWMAKKWPTVFGYQHIVKAIPSTNLAGAERQITTDGSHTVK